MKTNTKSSITLPPEELELVLALQEKLKAKSKVEVVRRGLRLLKEMTERDRLREAYRSASLATRASTAEIEGARSRGGRPRQAVRVRRGMLYLADLSPRLGTEPGKIRPVLVIQTDLLNEAKHPSTWVLPCTTRTPARTCCAFRSRGASRETARSARS